MGASGLGVELAMKDQGAVYSRPVLKTLRSVIRNQTWSLANGAALVGIMTYFWGWPAVVGGGGALVILLVIDSRSVPDDAPCGKCAHLKRDHHGNCQACLREGQHAGAQSEVPCSRFARAS